MRKSVSVSLVVVVAAIAVAASLDAFRSSSPAETRERTAGPAPATTSVRQPGGLPAPIWEGLHERTIRLGRRPAWDETRMLDPGTYELTFRIDVRPGADLDVSFRSTRPARVTHGLFGARVPRECSRENGRDNCSGAIEIDQQHSEEWTLAALGSANCRATPRRPHAYSAFAWLRQPVAGTIAEGRRQADLPTLAACTLESGAYATHLGRSWRRPRTGCGRGRVRTSRQQVVRRRFRDVGRALQRSFEECDCFAASLLCRTDRCLD
jgi:hypothetical protein